VDNAVKFIDDELAVSLEDIEARAEEDIYLAPDDDIKVKCGISHKRVGNLLQLTASKCDVLALNRVINVCLTERLQNNQVKDIIESFKQSNAARFFVQLPPIEQSVKIAELLIANGFTHYNNWVKLYRGIDPVPEIQTDLTIRQVDETYANDFARIVNECFGWPGLFILWMASVVGRPNWYTYLAFDKHIPAATGAFYHHGDFAWIDFAATLPEYRNRGAQAGLLRKRIQDAKKLGCKYLVVETAEETPEKAAPSFRNMIRYGFKTAYIRPNYIYNIS
jgi:GNAT superfamily N-acetyltransferase